MLFYAAHFRGCVEPFFVKIEEVSEPFLKCGTNVPPTKMCADFAPQCGGRPHGGGIERNVESFKRKRILVFEQECVDAMAGKVSEVLWCIVRFEPHALKVELNPDEGLGLHDGSHGWRSARGRLRSRLGGR